MHVKLITPLKKITYKSGLVLLFALILNACRTAPIYSATNIPTSPRPSATDEEISEAIWSAGRRLGWRIEKIKPGEMRGIYKIRTHEAVVAIYYDKTHFSIEYLNSVNLDYDGNEIHVNYNVWIHKLEQKIHNEISFRLPQRAETNGTN